MDAVGERALQYLEAHNVATLATCGVDGPWAAAVFFVNRGFKLYFLSSAASRHCANLAHSARAAAAVQEDYRDWREIKGVQLEGAVRVLEGAEEAQARALYGRKFPLVAAPPPPIEAALTRVRWYELAADRVYFIDNSAGFGHRDEIAP